MKKITSVICLLLVAVLLTACTTVYKSQQNISFNLNNLSAGNSGYWLENQVMFYTDLFDGENRVAMKNDTETIPLSKKDPWYYSTLQKYDHLIYYATYYDISNPESDTAELFVYDLLAKTETSLLKVESLIQFFVCEDKLFVLREQEYFDTYRYVAEFYDKTTLALLGKMENLYAFGVQNNRPIGIVTNTNQCNIMEWDFALAQTKEIGSFALPNTQDITLYDTVNITNQYLMMFTNHSKENTSQILLYHMQNKTLETVDCQGQINELVAFDNHAFASVWNEEDELTLCSFPIAKKELTPLGKIHEDKSLFVTSDEDVYLCSYTDTEVVHYRLDGTKESVLTKVSN